MKQAIPFILPAMLLAYGSVQAQTAPAQQAPQPIQQQTPQPPPQPAAQPSQQAAQPTPASPEQAATCGGVVNKTVTAMSKGDFNGATQSFDPNGKPSSDKLQQAWDALTKQYGNAKSIGDTKKGQAVQGYTVVLVPMQFDKGQVGAEAACGMNGQLVMLRFGLMPNASSKS
ncbi:hypothetical protein [Dyella agri]|uniref:DUF3887 domain-containing protein n=1 Tax=Dyella agri TaxID=1926869 RepID=A0ABW8KK47_9GAMM